MMNKWKFVFINGLAVLACGFLVTVLVQGASGAVLYKLNACALISKCASDREFWALEAAGPQFAGAMLFMFAFFIYGFLAFVYWAISSYEGLRNFGMSRQRLVISAVIVPSFVSALLCWVAKSDFMLMNFFIMTPLVSFFAFQSHWRILSWLKKLMIDNGRNGEIQCLN